jgi:hypothetical protein
MGNTTIFFINVGFTHWYTLTVLRHLLILIPLAIWWAVKHYLMKVKAEYMLAKT